MPLLASQGMAKPRKGYSFGISPQCISASACNECQGCRFELARETIPSFQRPKRLSQCTVVESTTTISLGFSRAKIENTAKVDVLVGHGAIDGNFGRLGRDTADAPGCHWQRSGYSYASSWALRWLRSYWWPSGCMDACQVRRDHIAVGSASSWPDARVRRLVAVTGDRTVIFC